MNITLYSFTKRKNSTARPTSGGTNYTGTLKANTSVVSPSIIFEFSAFPGVNYAYIQEFSRYYWITDKIHLANNLWQLDMHVDVLASYKTEIGNSSKYILRAASEYNGDAVDMKYPTQANVVYKKQTIKPFEDYEPQIGNRGTYIVGVVEAGAAVGAISYYALTEMQMNSLRSQLMTGQNYFGGITDPDIQNFAIVMGNPMQYIKSCRYYPLTGLASEQQTIMVLGTTNIPNMTLLARETISDNFGVLLNAHQDYTSRGAFTNYDPFTMRFLYWPPIGLVHLPSALFVGHTQLKITFDLDLTSGIGRILVETDSLDPTMVHTIVYESNFVLGFDVPMAQMISGDPTKIISGTSKALSAGLSAATLNIGGVVSGATGAIMDFISANTPQLTGYIAGSGSRLPVGSMVLLESFYSIADANNEEFGRPLMETRTISNLAASASSSGYVLCADGEIAIDGCEPEITEIESYLTGGFFYE